MGKLMRQPVDITSSAYQYRADRKAEENDPETTTPVFTLETEMATKTEATKSFLWECFTLPLRMAKRPVVFVAKATVSSVMWASIVAGGTGVVGLVWKFPEIVEAIKGVF